MNCCSPESLCDSIDGRSSVLMRGSIGFQRISLVCAAVTRITVVSLANTAYSQSLKGTDKEIGGAISGRVVIDGQPVRGVVVFVQPSDLAQGSVKLRARTDQNG